MNDNLSRPLIDPALIADDTAFAALDALPPERIGWGETLGSAAFLILIFAGAVLI